MACSKDFFEHAQRAGRSRGALEARVTHSMRERTPPGGGRPSWKDTGASYARELPETGSRKRGLDVI